MSKQINVQRARWIGVTSILPVVAGGVALGALLTSFFSPLGVALVGVLGGFCALGSLFLLSTRVHQGAREIPTQKKTFIFLALLFFALGAVSLRMSVLQESFISPPLQRAVGQIASLRGVIIEDPDARDSSVMLAVEVSEVNGVPAKAKVRVSVDRFSEFFYGDEVRIRGIPTVPESFATESGALFDYRHYLLAHGITYEIKQAQVHTVGHGKGTFIIASLLEVKRLLSHQIGVILPEPKSALLSGLLIGEKQSLGKHITDLFRNAGVVHMIVLSGYNVSLVARAIQKVCESFLPRALGFIAGGIGLVAFAVMTGASETTVRASIMALIMLVATALRRPSDALRVLTLAAGIMLFLNPYLLLYDLSFQLSCLATFGLILLSEPVAQFLKFIPEKFGFREVVASTIATEIVVAPILIVSVGQVSIVSVATNLAVLFAVPWTMLFGFIATILSFVSVFLAFPFTFLAYGLLNYILVVAMWFGSLPFAIITIPPALGTFVLIILGVLYAVAGWLLFRFRQSIFLIHPKRKKAS